MPIPLDRILLVTYGDRRYAGSRLVLSEEARAFGLTRQWVRTRADLPADFVARHAGFLAGNRRGSGYWIWKPLVVHEGLRQLSDGDFLLYCDAGCGFNPAGMPRFVEWIEFCAAHGVLSLGMGPNLEKTWTKMNVARLLGCDTPVYLDSGQFVGGVFMLRRSPAILDLVAEWLRIAEMEWTIDDSPSDIPNDPSFQEHRHDQSVWSLLRKKAGLPALRHRIHAKKIDWRNDPGLMQTPILALRRKAAVPGEAAPAVAS